MRCSSSVAVQLALLCFTADCTHRSVPSPLRGERAQQRARRECRCGATSHVLHCRARCCLGSTTARSTVPDRIGRNAQPRGATGRRTRRGVLATMCHSGDNAPPTPSPDVADSSTNVESVEERHRCVIGLGCLEDATLSTREPVAAGSGTTPARCRLCLRLSRMSVRGATVETAR